MGVTQRSEDESGFLLSVIVPSRDPGSAFDLLCEWVAPREGVEFIIVDDASTDDSAERIRSELAPRFESGLRIVEGLGEGPGPARNVGLHGATGEFVAFSDVDDLTHVNVLVEAAEACREGHADVGVCGYRRTVTSSSSTVDVLPSGVLPIESAPASSVLTERSAVWGKVYRRTFLSSRQLEFPPERGAEDVVFSYLLAVSRPRVLLLRQIAYNYLDSFDGRLTGTRSYFVAGARSLSSLLVQAPRGRWEKSLLAYAVLASSPYIVRGVGGAAGVRTGLRLVGQTARLGVVPFIGGLLLASRSRAGRLAAAGSSGVDY